MAVPDRQQRGVQSTFALPGGFIYVNRGVFEAAENEAQLAGVITHESGHVVMSHGTHMASQAVLAQGGMAILTSIFSQSGSLTSQLAQLGLGLGVNWLLLHSRTAETQADEVGTYLLYDQRRGREGPRTNRSVHYQGFSPFFEIAGPA